ncbi:MAG: TraB/GumN family protein, partial [Solirubrobacteraceae bacterium]
VYLERASYQLQILGKWMDTRALKMMLDELPENERRARAMLDAYAQGDDRTIVAISDGEKDAALQHGYNTAEYDQEMNEVLYDRNASWIDAIDRMHATGGAFVAVGAMHLVGPRSVLELLAHKGYQVTRVAADAAP